MSVDVIILGGGAAGLMCALRAGQRGRKVLLLDHAEKVGKKILISGGGRCNFTNRDSRPEAFLSANPHFCKSALARYTQYDFIALVEKHRIAWHEKTLGQLFCDGSARQIVAMLLDECAAVGVDVRVAHRIASVEKSDRFTVKTDHGDFESASVVLATGGLSIRKMRFREAMLFTHRGLSGPAILQVSSYWQPWQEIAIDLLPDIEDAAQFLKERRHARPKAELRTILAEVMPQRLANVLAETGTDRLNDWRVVPTGTEGYAKAEVTVGGVDTDGLSSKTMEAKKVPGLHVIGEAVDVTGWLGGYNFQWAWSSGWAAGDAV